MISACDWPVNVQCPASATTDPWKEETNLTTEVTEAGFTEAVSNAASETTEGTEKWKEETAEDLSTTTEEGIEGSEETTELSEAQTDAATTELVSSATSA